MPGNRPKFVFVNVKKFSVAATAPQCNAQAAKRLPRSYNNSNQLLKEKIKKTKRVLCDSAQKIFIPLE